jgi:hypothetical protein
MDFISFLDWVGESDLSHFFADTHTGSICLGNKEYFLLSSGWETGFLRERLPFLPKGSIWGR